MNKMFINVLNNVQKIQYYKIIYAFYNVIIIHIFNKESVLVNVQVNMLILKTKIINNVIIHVNIIQIIISNIV